MIKMEDNEVLILVDSAEHPVDLDANRAKSAQRGYDTKTKYSGIQFCTGASGKSNQSSESKKS